MGVGIVAALAAVLLVSCGGSSGDTAPTASGTAEPTPVSAGWTVVQEARVDRNQVNLYAVASSQDADFVAEARACAQRDKAEDNERYCWLYPTREDFAFADVPEDGSSVGKQCWVAQAGAGVDTAEVTGGQLNEYMAPNCPSYESLFPTDESLSADEQVCHRYTMWYLGVSDEPGEVWAEEMRRLAGLAESQALREALLAEAESWAAGAEDFDSNVYEACGSD